MAGDEWYLWTLRVKVLFIVSVLTAWLSHRKSESPGIGLLQLSDSNRLHSLNLYKCTPCVLLPERRL